MLGLLGVNKYLLGGTALVVVVLGLYAGFLKLSLDSAQKDILLKQAEIEQLETDKKALELSKTVEVAAKEIIQKNLKNLEERLEKEKIETDNLLSRLERIYSAGEEEDGPVAKVLKDVFVD